VFLFCINDAVGKWLVATYSVGEFLLIRSAHTLLLLAPFIWRAGRAPFRERAAPGCSSARCVCRRRSRAVLLGGVYLPLADAITFYLAARSTSRRCPRCCSKERSAGGAGRGAGRLCGVVIALRPPRRR
jgi:hypothetical protein